MKAIAVSADFPPQDVRLPCAADPELFTRTGWSGTEARKQVHEARAVCATCLFRAECLSWAMQHRDPYTFAGGLTPSQRDKRRFPRKKS